MTGLMGGGHALWIDGETGARHESRLLRGRSRAGPAGAGTAAGSRFRGVRKPDRRLQGRDRLLRGAGSSGRARGALAPPRPPALGRGWSSRRSRSRATAIPMPLAHALCLAMLAPVMTLGDGAEIFSPEGTLLETGDRLVQPGLARALEHVAEEGPDSMYTGTLGEALLGLMDELGGPVTPRRPRRIRATVVRAGGAELPGPSRRDPRRPLADCGDGLRARSSPRASPGGRAVTLARALAASPGERAHDEPRHGRPGRKRMRPHLEPRARLGRFPAGAPGAPELDARRDGADRRPAEFPASGCRA